MIRNTDAEKRLCKRSMMIIHSLFLFVKVDYKTDKRRVDKVICIKKIREIFTTILKNNIVINGDECYN